MSRAPITVDATKVQGGAGGDIVLHVVDLHARVQVRVAVQSHVGALVELVELELEGGVLGFVRGVELRFELAEALVLVRDYGVASEPLAARVRARHFEFLCLGATKVKLLRSGTST